MVSNQRHNSLFGMERKENLDQVSAISAMVLPPTPPEFFFLKCPNADASPL